MITINSYSVFNEIEKFLKTEIHSSKYSINLRSIVVYDPKVLYEYQIVYDIEFSLGFEYYETVVLLKFGLDH